ncbi:hypothetical protein CYR55_12755 [Chimaeribacter californicus]|uniref:Uncharacterized protein n=1 Tax=Chimaeribacter californicus TaxID=2060067 RepID=A0A2N5E4D2_9GAMM|nr:hypothetical protein [Chimaeribacter californicus]PLR35836.1 hypothetical protein CYR55_12755 [Chimaeribacter californicus]
MTPVMVGYITVCYTLTRSGRRNGQPVVVLTPAGDLIVRYQIRPRQFPAEFLLIINRAGPLATGFFLCGTRFFTALCGTGQFLLAALQDLFQSIGYDYGDPWAK